MKNTRKSLLFCFLLTSLMLLDGCSTDNVAREDDTEAPDNSDQDATDDPQDPNSDNTAETIEFETAFTLDKDRMLTNLVLSEAAYDDFLQGEGDLQMVSNKVYEYFQDDFDFIFILSVEQEQPSGLYFGRSSSAQNAVQGLGSGLWDNTAAYGSQGRLKTIIHMPRTEYVRTGPFLHEIAHYWANHGLIETTVGGHWGYASVGGQLGGFDEIEDLGNDTYLGKLNGNDGFGTFANGGNSLPYGNLELYAMGLIGADELETILVAQNPQSTQQFGVFTADQILSLTAGDIIAENGERVPSVQNSQKEFAGLVVVISKNAIDQAKIDQLNSDLENFERPGEPDWNNTYNFWKATGGRATLRIEVAQASIK